MRRIAEHKRKIWKAMEHTIGMRIPLFLAFLILTLVPLLVQVRFTSGYFYQSHVEERMAEVHKLLELPKEVAVFSLFALGYPAESRAQEDRFYPERIHFLE